MAAPQFGRVSRVKPVLIRTASGSPTEWPGRVARGRDTAVSRGPFEGNVF